MLVSVLKKKSKCLLRPFSVEMEVNQILNKKCYYDIFDLPQSSSKKEVKKRYRDLTKTYHPDLWRDKRSHLVYSKILEAYTILEDDKKRVLYNNFINKNSPKQQNFEQRWEKHQSYSHNSNQKYDYWNRKNTRDHSNFTSTNQNTGKNYQNSYEERYYDQKAKHDREFYAKARRAGKRMSSQEAEETRKQMISGGWLLLFGLILYVTGADGIYDYLFSSKYEKQKAIENRRMKEERFYRSEKKQDTETTIGNRIVQFQKEMDEKKIVISLEQDDIRLNKKETVPKSIKQINKRMKRFNPKYKLVKSKKAKAANRKMTLRQHYDNLSNGEGLNRRRREEEGRMSEVEAQFDESLIRELKGGYM